MKSGWMPHRIFAIITVAEVVLLGGVSALALVMAVALNLVVLLVLSIVAYYGMRAMMVAAKSELAALRAHKHGKWCGHAHCGKDVAA